MKLVPGTEDRPGTLLHIARLASSAGAKVLAGRGQGLLDAAADTKSAAGDWVTEFDRGAERAVREVLSTFRPRDLLTGEEYPDAGGEPDGFRWSIDPLDGTANFVRGIVYYATSVGVYGPDDTGAPRWLAGAVTAPALGVQYFAALGLGAFKASWGPEGTQAPSGRAEALQTAPADGAARLSAGDRPAGDGARLLATGFGYDQGRRDFQARAMASLMPDYANVRRLGSAALDLCLVAEGVLDAYAEFGTHEWDWAAGALIAEEAGLPVGRPTEDPGWQWAGAIEPGDLPTPPSTLR